MPVELPALIAQRIRQDVQSMHAYAVQDSAGLIKLDAMENPYRLSASLQHELGERLSAVPINRYPDQRIDALKRAVAAHAQLLPGQALMLGNGSDELISLLAMACDRPTANPADPMPTVLAPLPGFVMYAMSAQLQGLRFVGVDLRPDFSLDVPAMCAAIAEHRPAITYLAYPNNPTANLWAQADVQAVIDAVGDVGGLVVMDEAYQPFASRTWQDVLRSAGAKRPAHVLVMRTLSKFGLAGVRLGYLLGQAALVAHIDKLRPPYNVSMLNAECALFALEHADTFASQAQAIREQRQRLLAELPQVAGVQQVFDSDANMILLRVPDAPATFAGLRQRGVLVKNVGGMHPLLRNCLRLTVGTADENTQLLGALRSALA
jgi:histidinol-phosphate aminotransferase